MNYLVFDIETQRLVESWDRPWEAGLSVGVTWTTREGFRIWTMDTLEEFAACLSHADMLVGYNSIGFDQKMLMGLNGAFSFMSGKPHYDMCKIVGDHMRRRVRCQELLEANLGIGKTEDGANAPQMFADGDIARLWAYCVNDVERERDLFHFSQRHGYLLCPVSRGSDRLVKVPMPRAEEVAYAF